MKIIVNRDSVCAGDDTFNHEMTFEVPESLTVAEFLDEAGGNPHFFVRYYSNPELAKKQD